MSKFKVGDMVTLTGDSYETAGLHLGGTYPVTTAETGSGFYLTGEDGFQGYFFDSEAVLSTSAPTPPAPKLPRLEIQAAPQGGFLVIALSTEPVVMSELLSAHSEIGDALEFMRRAMA